MDSVTALRELGLTENEAKIYLALLHLDSAPIGTLHQEAAVNRANAYGALRRLMEKGLVGMVVKDGKKWYTPADPARLEELVEEKKKLVAEVMPALRQAYTEKKEPTSITSFRGLKGVKSVFYDILHTGKDVCVFGHEGQILEKLPYVVPQFRKKKVEKGIHTRIIKRATAENIHFKPGPLTSVRFVPQDVESPVETTIYGNKIAVVLWTEKTPEAVVIENKKAADSYRAYYELLWNKHTLLAR